MDEITIGPGCKISSGEAFDMPIIDLAYSGADKVTLTFEGTDEQIREAAMNLTLAAAEIYSDAGRRIARRD